MANSELLKTGMLTLSEGISPAENSGSSAPSEGEALPEDVISAIASENSSEESGSSNGAAASDNEEDTPENSEDNVLLTATAEPSPAADTTAAMLKGAAIGVAAAVITAAAALIIKKAINKNAKKKAPFPDETSKAGKIDLKIGKVHEQGSRDYQEDCFAVTQPELVSSKGFLAVVADGMGGLDNGDKVSQAAVTAMINSFYTVSGDSGDILVELTRRARQAVDELSAEMRYTNTRGGSTLIAGILKEDSFSFISIGDSRVYLFRDGELIQLNREHDYRTELLERAVNGKNTVQAAITHPGGNKITSYMGMGEIKYIDIPAGPLKVRAGDKLVLMTDGVYNALSEDEMKTALSAEYCSEELRKAVLDKNYSDQDNFTAVILAL